MRIAATLLLLVALTVMSAGGLCYMVYADLTGVSDLPEKSVYVDIPLGMTTDEAIARLKEMGVIKQTLPLKLYIKWRASRQAIRAGRYRLDSPISPLGALAVLEKGEPEFNKLTVIEGWTRWDVAQALTRLPALKLTSPASALALIGDTSAIKDLDPRADSLEGYLYPDTYFVVPGTGGSELIGQMVRRFRAIWQEKLSQSARARRMPVREVVTVASIVETEAKLKGERPLVASVIYNRLARGMPLAMDSTVVYASKLAGKWRNDGKVYQSDLDLPSPYNTRKYAGLPPGPVGNPGFASLWAALNPAKSEYLYYVRNPERDDGQHHFYRDEKSFALGVKALRDWEKRRDKR